jgi:transposase
VIELRSGTRIWIAAGFTDLRRGFQGLSTLVETVLEQAPYSGHVFVFRGKRGDLIKPGCVYFRTNWLHTTPLSIGTRILIPSLF